MTNKLEIQPQNQDLSVYRVYHPAFDGFKLYGGEYPSSGDELAEFIKLGITTSIFLAEGISPDYKKQVIIKNPEFKLLHYPIADFSAPTKAFMITILDKIDELIAQGETLYVHGVGGHGRTGTIIGCWLKRHGFKNQQVYTKLSNWRRQTLFGDKSSPESPEQFDMINEWRKGTNLLQIIWQQQEIIRQLEQKIEKCSIEVESSQKQFDKIAIISDIHGNLPGLLAVMADIDNCQCDRIICLGDLVDGGDYNDEVVKYIIDNNIISVRGNHDEYNDLELPKNTQSFLKTLPEEIIESDIIYTHISPRTKKVSIKDEIEAWNVFGEIFCRLAFVGHIHIPLIFGEKCEQVGMSTCYEFKYGIPFQFNETDRYIISVGSITNSRDNVNKPRYVIYNKLENYVEFRAVDAETFPLIKA